MTFHFFKKIEQQSIFIPASLSLRFLNRLIALSLLPLLAFAACKPDAKNEGNKAIAERSTITHAQGFSIDSYPNGLQLNVHQVEQNSRDTLSYFLSETRPENLASAQWVPLPVNRLACTSTTHVAMLAELGAVQTLIGMAGTEYVYNPEVRKAIDRGQVQELGPTGQQDPEAIVALQPDIFMTSSFNLSSASGLNRVQKLGIPVVVNSEWLENSPLGRAEWIKFIGALIGKSALADSIFQSVSGNYRTLKATVNQQKNKPAIMVGMSFKGNWFVPAGESFTARLIADAGGEYIWKDLPGNASQQLDFEAVYQAAQSADIWINVGSAQNLDDLIGAEPRMASFPALSSQKVYNHNRRLNANGWNDFFESAALRPDVVLADLIAIFHPELLPGHNFYYYKQLAIRENIINP